MTQDDRSYLTAGEVADRLKVSPKTVARWAKAGFLPYLSTLGGHRRFPRSAVDEVARKMGADSTQSS